MRVWGITDMGLVRQENQDAYVTASSQNYEICVVCDGMGGTNGGRVASSIAVDRFVREMGTALQQPLQQEQLTQQMCLAVAHCNEAIREKAAQEEAYQHMGTTLVGAICTDTAATVCNIGDSRAYHITADGIEQITRDHSVVENMVERGELTHAEARHHPNRNLITRALGPDPTVEVDVFEMTWQAGEYLLLCTDGLVNTVTDQEILFEVIHSEQLEGCLQRLLEIAESNGAPDNVTMVLIENNGKEMA